MTQAEAGRTERYRFKGEDGCWVVEVGKERERNGKRLPFTWKADGYFTRLGPALEFVLDRALRVQSSQLGEIRESLEAYRRAVREVDELAKSLLQGPPK